MEDDTLFEQASDFSCFGASNFFMLLETFKKCPSPKIGSTSCKRAKSPKKKVGLSSCSSAGGCCWPESYSALLKLKTFSKHLI